MTNRTAVRAAMLALALAAPWLPGATPAPARLRSVTLHVFSRVFPSFHDKLDVKPRTEFRVGDTEYTARLVEFVPDFTMDLKTHRVTTRGPEPRNPAFRMVVQRNGAPVDTVWAFFNLPPHFARTSLLAFVATHIEFENHAPIDSQDSLATRIHQREQQGAR